jgi:hypothetical protein
MKKLFAFLVVFFLAFFIGCQENSITDPVALDENAAKNQPPTNVNSGVIELNERINDPRPTDHFNCFDVLGQVKYEHSLAYAGPRIYVKLNLKTNAELKEPFSDLDQLWTVEGESQDFILMTNVKDRPPTTITKTYSVQGRDDGMKLVIKFAVSMKDIRLNEVKCYFEKVPDLPGKDNY